MVSLNPVLRCLLSIEDSVTRGDAVRDALMQWLDEETRKSGNLLRASRIERDFRQELMTFLRQIEGFDDTFTATDASKIKCGTLYRQSLVMILLEGIRGNSILPRLRELRFEIEAQLELDMKAHVESLPLKMLLPLLFCMFPAFLILLLGPITRNFVEALK